MPKYKGTTHPVEHHMYKYATKGKYDKQEVEVDGKKYTIHIPSGNEYRAMENSKNNYKEVYDYLKEHYQTRGDGTMIFDKEEDHIFEPHIRAIRKGFTETGLGWGINCKFWYDNLFLEKSPAAYEKQMYVAITPNETLRQTKPKKEKAKKTPDELKTGEWEEYDASEVIIGDELGEVTQYVPIKKKPTETRKEFTQRIKDEKERHYKEFLETYYKYGIDPIGTTKSYVGSRRPFGEEAEAVYYVFKDKDPEAWNKIVKEHPELAKHKKLLKDPKEFFENFYYLESESEPSEGFLSSEAESEYQGESSEYEYDPDTWHGYAEGDPYSDLEKEEEIIEKMPAPEPAPAPAPAPAPPPAPRSKQEKRDLLRQRMQQRKKKSESAKAPAPPPAPAPAPPPAPAPAPDTGSVSTDVFLQNKDKYEKAKVLNANPALKDAGWQLVWSKNKKEHYYFNKKTGKSQFEPPTPPSGGKKTRKKRGKRTKKSQMKKSKKTKRISRLRGGKRTKKKKSTRKKKRGGVAPSVPPVSRGNQTRRSQVRHGPALLQGLNQVRNMDSAYIGIAMERLSNPDLVLAMDQEGTLDDVLERVTERITFFINRNPQNREQLRMFLDETPEAQQTLDRDDSNLGNRYRNFIEQLRRLTE